ncbi:MAG: hypothetical protein ACYDC1_22690, partial [Limisphaerales bacterium]
MKPREFRAPEVFGLQGSHPVGCRTPVAAGFPPQDSKRFNELPSPFSGRFEFLGNSSVPARPRAIVRRWGERDFPKDSKRFKDLPAPFFGRFEFLENFSAPASPHPVSGAEESGISQMIQSGSRNCLPHS